MALNVTNADVVLTTSASTVYNDNTAVQATIVMASALNRDSVDRLLTVYRVGIGSVPSVSNELIKDMAIAPGETVILPIAGQTLVNGQTLQALADASNVVNFNVSLILTS